jgi:catechol 2,3-dioxygenase-like lactoylglutathione lyase family enzyme
LTDTTRSSNSNTDGPHQRLGQIALLVRDYDEALDYFIRTLGFECIKDTVQSETKRWVVVAPPGSTGMHVLLAKAKNDAETSRIGDQTGGRVFLFLYTNDFKAYYERLRLAGVDFTEEPRQEAYGHVVVFRDLYGNLWDLIERA